MRLRRTLIKPDDSPQPERVIPGSLRLTNTQAVPFAGILANARPQERSGFDGVSPYRDWLRLGAKKFIPTRNGDGKTDLLFQHDDGTVAVWLMDGINLISGEFLNPEDPGSGWRIAGPR